MKVQLLLKATLLAAVVVAASPPAMADTEPRNLVPALAMGAQNADLALRAAQDGSNPERAAVVTDQIAATCSAANAWGSLAISVMFTDDAQGERLMRTPGLGATPNLQESVAGPAMPRLFPVPMESNDRLAGYSADPTTAAIQELLETYTEVMQTPERQQFAYAYTQALCR